MDSKKVIEKLVKIAGNQQKIIAKLAQDLVSVQTDLKDICQNILTTLSPGHHVTQVDKAGDKVRVVIDPKLQDTGVLNKFKDAVAAHTGATTVIVA